jgi:antitoxin component YwqK of YwqJK toxin-antitoxin module
MTEKKNGIIRIYCDKAEKKLWYEYFIFNNKREGEYKDYYKNGQLYEIVNYKNNNLEGEHKQYWVNKQLSVIYNYKNNKKEGKYKGYQNNGELYMTFNYKNDKRVIYKI